MHQDPNQPQTPADSNRQPSLPTDTGTAPSLASAVTESGLGPVPPSTPALEVVLRRLSLVVQKWRMNVFRGRGARHSRRMNPRVNHQVPGSGQRRTVCISFRSKQERTTPLTAARSPLRMRNVLTMLFRERGCLRARSR